MKTILLTLLSLSLSLGVSAQRKLNSDEHHENSEERNEYSQEYQPRVYNVPLVYGFGYNYPYYGYGYPYYGFPYYDYPYYGNSFWYRPFHNRNKAIQYKLSLQLKAIKMDYANKIKQARHDKSLSRFQKKQKILSLKNERNESIVNTEKKFVNQLNMGNQNPGIKSNQKHHNSNSLS